MKIYKINQNSRGFTLIELLVVIAIIGLLSSIVMTSLNSARARARDAQRIANIKQVQNALELYYNDNGQYISSMDVPLVTALTTALTPTYISRIPADPSGYASQYYNNAQNPAQFYAIYIAYETKPHCYVCYGTGCIASGWWSVSMCQ